MAWPNNYAEYTYDSNGNVVGLNEINPYLSTRQPYYIATFGDSRVNSSSTNPDVSGSQLNTNVRVPAFVAGLLGDSEITRNYGVSGDTAVLWNKEARTGGKTYRDLELSNVDAVLVQYGVNDAMALTSSATIISALQALCSQIIKSGKLLIFESINPINTPVGSYVAVQAIIDTVNIAMQSWLTNFTGYAVYADTASALKLNGYANPAYYSTDGVHFTFNGAYKAASIIATEARKLLPKRQSLFYGKNTNYANMLNLNSMSYFSAAEAGTATISTPTTGLDKNGTYIDWIVTPTALTSSECRVRLDLSVNFQTAAVPYAVLYGNEIIQGSARVIFDNGFGSAPAAYELSLRHRFYTGGVFRDFGIIPQAPTANFPDLLSPLDMQIITPAVINQAASVVATPADATGYQLQVYIEMQQTGTPVRVRVYNPQLRVIDLHKLPLTSAPFLIPASTVAYTNTSSGNQQVTVGGGAVTVLAVNGTTTGLTSGSFILAPNDTLTPTYTVAPTWVVKQI